MDHTRWWNDAVIYHIYPRSFLDTNGDGYGDLNGITAKLPYLRDLGIDAIWMGPIFRSPQVDNGYDVADYRAVDPLFGTNDDLQRLIDDAHRQNIRVLLDLVFNHTSDRHTWFQRSSSGDPDYADYYIWRDPPPGGGRPNDWGSFFSDDAWTWHPGRGQYYLHLFAVEQPDLNWEHPRVREELADIANFWLDRGVDGFRMDVINMISKAPGLPSLNGASPSGIYIDGPRMLEYLQEFRRRLRRRDEIVLVGETPAITPGAARSYTAAGAGALDMVLLFDHLTVDHGPGGRWDPQPLRPDRLGEVVAAQQEWLAAPSWPSIYMSNHDQPRIVSRYGDDREFRFESATALAGFFYLQRGTPIVYQGDEIGMANYPLSGVNEIVDIESLHAYHTLVDGDRVPPDIAFHRIARNARDNGRTPMQWSSAEYGGFTPAGGAPPWFPVNPDYPVWNVEAQLSEAPENSGASRGGHDEPRANRRIAQGEKHDDTAEELAPPSTVLAFYRRLFEVRRESEVLRRGSIAFDAPTRESAPPRGDANREDDARSLRGSRNDSLISYTRAFGDSRIRVVVNLSSEEMPPEDAVLERIRTGRLLLSNYPVPIGAAATHVGGNLHGNMRPWELRVIEEQK